MKFIVKNKETGEIISPRNYYFVIKQNGELYTFGGNGKFQKADDKYIYVLCKRQAKDYISLEDILGNMIEEDRKSTRLNSSHTDIPRMPSSA